MAGSTSDVNLDEFDFDSVATTINYIDRGAFGEVYGPFTWNSKQCAFKRIWISAGKPGNDFKIKVEEKRKIWTSVKHKNLIEIHNVILRPKTLYIVMEYASGGSLRRLLENSDVCHKIPVSNWATKIADGMLYLHERNIVHRDLKSNNIMLMDPFESMYPHEKMTLKLTDFDDAREHTHTTTMSLRGTVAYMAPEVLRTEKFSRASDVWSFGVVVWEMLTGEFPHKDDVDGTIMFKAVNGQLTIPVPDSTPTDYKNLLCECLHQDKDRRPPFDCIVYMLNSFDKTKASMRSYMSESIQLKTRIQPSSERPEPTIGVCILDRLLYVAREQTLFIEVFTIPHITTTDLDPPDHVLVRTISVPQLEMPFNMAASPQSSCLYLTDFGQNVGCVWKVTPKDNVTPEDHVMKFAVGVGRPMGISISRDNYVIVVSETPNCLRVFSKSGEKVLEMPLSDFEAPRQAICIEPGRFALIHGYLEPDNRVVELDTSGHVLRSYGSTIGDGYTQIHWPASLIHDSQGWMLVGDRENCRVHLVQRDFRLRRHLVRLDNTSDAKPRRLCIDDLNGTLYIGQTDSEIQVYRIANPSLETSRGLEDLLVRRINCFGNKTIDIHNLNELPVGLLQTIVLKAVALHQRPRKFQRRNLAKVCAKWKNIVIVLHFSNRLTALI